MQERSTDRIDTGQPPSVEVPCPECKGSGNHEGIRCPVCGGSGLMPEGLGES